MTGASDVGRRRKVARMRRMWLNDSLAAFCDWVLTEVAAGRRKAVPTKATERELELLFEQEVTRVRT